MSTSLLNIKNWTTQNGVHTLFVQRHELPIVDIEICFEAGSAFDKNKYGLSQFTTCMLNQGTEKYSADDIANKFMSLGVRVALDSDRDQAKISFRSLKNDRYLIPALELLADLITSPTFSSNPFLLKKNLILNVIERQHGAPDILARNMFYRTLYQRHPYAHPILGTQNTISAMTQNDLTEFHQQFYNTENTVIHIVGDISKTKAKEIAEQLSRQLPQGERPKIPVAHYNQHAKIDKLRFPSKQAYIFMGQAGITFTSPYYPALLVGNDILGGSALTSRLFNVLREHYGLAYSVSSALSPLKGGGPFIVILQPSSRNLTKALQITQRVLTDFINEGPKPKELAISKKKIANKILFSMGQNSNILNILNIISTYSLPLNFLDLHLDSISNLNKSQIRAAFEENFCTNQLVTSIVCS